ncbi:hypothetical protein Glove_194g170 [Diversispora epigaea]|uniref:Uncharacterized protein n=1 Tax=Diversispora epigaea TaxID=1348612 RepID=A0A397IL94_9GLOM|nr:hypothetical protein Glove_194g170 [Diversispora epigaea]
MLSRLFLISTLLLVGITTVAIGAAIGKTIEVTRAFKIPRMRSDQPGWVDSDTTCPDDTTCMEFVSIPADEEEEIDPFALCIDDDFLRRFDSDHKSGIFCKTYVINDVANAKATISINIYDITQKPAQVTSVSITVGNQLGTKFNTHNYSRIIDCKNGEKIEMCIQTGTKDELFGYFSYLDGTYS